MDIEILFKFFDFNPAVDNDVPIDEFRKGIFLHIMFIVNLADDFLYQVLQRYKARSTAVLVNHDGHMRFLFLEFVKQGIDVFCFRYEVCVA